MIGRPGAIPSKTDLWGLASEKGTAPIPDPDPVVGVTLAGTIADRVQHRFQRQDVTDVATTVVARVNVGILESGNSIRPCRSTTRVSAPIRAPTASSVPTATIRPPTTATACRPGLRRVDRVDSAVAEDQLSRFDLLTAGDKQQRQARQQTHTHDVHRNLPVSAGQLVARGSHGAGCPGVRSREPSGTDRRDWR